MKDLVGRIQFNQIERGMTMSTNWIRSHKIQQLQKRQEAPMETTVVKITLDQAQAMIKSIDFEYVSKEIVILDWMRDGFIIMDDCAIKWRENIYREDGHA